MIVPPVINGFTRLNDVYKSLLIQTFIEKVSVNLHKYVLRCPARLG